MRFAVLAAVAAVSLLTLGSSVRAADPEPQKFYLIDGKVTTEKRVDALEKRVAELEAKLAKAEKTAAAPVARQECGCAYCTCSPQQAGKPFDPVLNCGSYACPTNGGAKPATLPGAITTASGRQIVWTGSGYVYADEANLIRVHHPAQPGYTILPASGSSCPGGNCRLP